MSKELEIIFKIKDDSARQFEKAKVDSFARIEAAAKRNADSQERTGARVTAKAVADAQKQAAAAQKAAEMQAAAQEKAAQKAAEMQAKASAKVAAEAEKAAARVAAAFDRAAAAQTQAANKAADADLKASQRRSDAAQKAAQKAVDAAEKSANAQKAAAQKSVDAEAARVAKLDMLGRQVLSKEEVQLRARAAANQKLQQARVDAATKALGAEKSSWGSLTSIVGETGAAVAAAGAAYLTLQAGKTIVMGIAEAWAAQRKDVEESILRVTKYQEKLLELSQLKGKFGMTTGEVADQVKFRSQTLQTADQAQKFQEGLLNSGQATVKAGFMSQEQLDKLAVHTGSYQAATNADPNALGLMTGTLPELIGGKDQKADETFRRLSNIMQIFQEGKSDQSSAVAQFSKNSALTTAGLYRSPEQQAGLQSLFSLSVPDEAGTRVDQFTRATVGALGRMKGPKMEGAESQGEYLKGLGATNQMDPIQIGKLVAADLAKQEGASKAKGQDFNGYDYLTHKGYTEETRMALLDFSARQNSGQYAKTFEPMSTPDAAPTMDQATKGIRDFRVGDVAGDRRNQVTADAADISRGVGARAKLLQAQKDAFNRLLGQNKTSGTFEASHDGVMGNIYRGMIDDEVQRETFERAKKAGVDTSEYGEIKPADVFKDFLGSGKNTGVLGGLPGSRAMYSEATRAQKYAELESKIAAAGGPARDNSDLIKAMDRNTKAAEDLENALRGNKPNAAVGGAPPVLPAQPAGVPKRI